MNVYYKATYTDHGPDSKLVSLGVVTEDFKHSFYAEFNDYKLSDCSKRTLDEVFPTLWMNPVNTSKEDITIISNYNSTYCHGPFNLIRDELVPWLTSLIIKEEYPSLLMITDMSYDNPRLIVDIFPKKKIHFAPADAVPVNTDLGDPAKVFDDLIFLFPGYISPDNPIKGMPRTAVKDAMVIGYLYQLSNAWR